MSAISRAPKGVEVFVGVVDGLGQRGYGDASGEAKPRRTSPRDGSLLDRHGHRRVGLALADAHPQRQGRTVLLDGEAQEGGARDPALEGVAHVDAGQLLQGGVVALVTQEGREPLRRSWYARAALTSAPWRPP